MDKLELSNKIATWLKIFLLAKFSETHDVLEILIPESNLSKLPNQNIKSCENYSAWEFTPDVLGILKNKNINQIELVLVNRSTSALSLKEIGELYTYSKLVNSKLSFLVSSNGVSNEVNILLLEDAIRKRLFNYGEDHEIIIFSWNEKNNGIDSNSIIPLDKKEFLLT